MVAFAWNLGTQEIKAGGSPRVQGNPGLHSQFNTNLKHTVRLCPPITQRKLFREWLDSGELNWVLTFFRTQLYLPSLVYTWHKNCFLVQLSLRSSSPPRGMCTHGLHQQEFKDVWEQVSGVRAAQITVRLTRPKSSAWWPHLVPKILMALLMCWFFSQILHSYRNCLAFFGLLFETGSP